MKNVNNASESPKHNTYFEPVTVMREFTVPDKLLRLEREFQRGKQDRKEGKPCIMNNGAYLNGWYSDDTQEYYYITKYAAHLL